MNSMMNAIVFSEVGEFEYTQRPVPEVTREDDVQIKILAASICGTDVHILENPPGIVANKGIILGHECVGEVVETGAEVIALKPGDRVILDNNVPCGVCAACQTGNSNLCKRMASMGVHTDGVFTQYAVAPERQMVRIPEDIPLKQAIFAEPLNCVMGAVKKLKVMPGDTAVVLGGGPIGLYFTTLMKACGAGQVIVSEVSDFRAEYARAQGADVIVNPKEQSLEEEVRKLTEGNGADIVIDAVGVLINDAIRAVKNGGSILLFGQNAAARQEICQNDITGRGLTVYGNYIGNYTLKNVAKLLVGGQVDFTGMITHELPLKDFAAGLKAMQEGKALEVILYPFED
ncbi:MAG: zinc-dependent alcohol dehydrogenase [Lachnospiraceae bacterium]